MESIKFTGDNFEEIKSFHPGIEKFTHNIDHNYTIGWRFLDKPFPDDANEIEMVVEALPGYFIVKEDDEYKVYDPKEYRREFGRQ